MRIHNCEQRSPEWLEIRKLKMTASKAQEIGNNDKGLKTYIYSLVANNFVKEQEQYTNEAMERGVELETSARIAYEFGNNVDVKEVGFVEYNEFVGCSPDGLVGDDGLIEIKCHNDVKHFKLFIDDKIESKYVWQMQMQMLICGRQWCDYVAYNPNFNQSLYIQRVYADKEMQDKLLKGFETGEAIIKELVEKFNKKINGSKIVDAGGNEVNEFAV